MTEKRRDFDAAARTWDDNPVRAQLGLQVATAIREAVPLAADWLALDYGCGTGLLTLLLAADVRHIIAADSSAGMLEVLAGKLHAAGVDNVTTRQWDLTDGVVVEERFGLICSNMTMHHIPDPAALVARFAELLEPGGWLALSDLDAEDGGFHPDPTGVFHRGFSAEQMQGFFAAVGLTAVRTVPAYTVSRPNAAGEMRHYPVLLTVGRK